MQCSCGGVCIDRTVVEKSVIVVEYKRCVACGRVLITKDTRNEVADCPADSDGDKSRVVRRVGGIPDRGQEKAYDAEGNKNDNQMAFELP